MQNSSINQLLFAGLVVFATTLAANAAETSAPAKAPKPPGVTATVRTPVKEDNTGLKEQLAQLAQRVFELEKAQADEVGAPEEEDDDKTKVLEQRVAALEKALANEKADNGKDDKNDDDTLVVKAPFVVQDDDGRTIFRVDVAPGSDRSRVVVGNPVGAHAELGPDTSNGAVIALYDSSNTLRTAMVGTSQGSYLRLKSRGDDNLWLGDYDQKGQGLTMTSSGGPQVTISQSKSGGAVKVFSAGGVAVGGLFGDPAGGGMALTGPAGGRSVLSLAVDSEGGKVRLFPTAGGKARVVIGASATNGEISLNDSAGSASALMRSTTAGAGYLSLSNSAGINVVEAGSGDGVGFVKTGPAGGLSTAPGMPPSFLKGWKK